MQYNSNRNSSTPSENRTYTVQVVVFFMAHGYWLKPINMDKSFIILTTSCLQWKCFFLNIFCHYTFLLNNSANMLMFILLPVAQLFGAWLFFSVLHILCWLSDWCHSYLPSAAIAVSLQTELPPPFWWCSWTALYNKWSVWSCPVFQSKK